MEWLKLPHEPKMQMAEVRPHQHGGSNFDHVLYYHLFVCKNEYFKTVLRIRIRFCIIKPDPYYLPGSGSVLDVTDPDL